MNFFPDTVLRVRWSTAKVDSGTGAVEWTGSIDDPAAYRINKSGVYHCSFVGQATLSGPTITNKAYDAGTNVTSFDITIAATNNGCVFTQLFFTGTKRTAASVPLY